jgi:hypothetical protein
VSSGLVRGFVALSLIATIASAGCGSSNSRSPTSSSSASIPSAHSTSTPRSTRRAQRPKPKPKAAPTRQAAPPCRAPTDVLAGVYHPDRLHVLSACRAVSGTVVRLSHEQDGDLHIALDTGGALTNAVNASDVGGSLVVEFMPRDGGHLPAPTVGEHISLTGAWVLDANHGWNELHPVWSETLAGITHHSGPQYGGSPADVGSSQAAADCTSNGSVCEGYVDRTPAK